MIDLSAATLAHPTRLQAHEPGENKRRDENLLPPRYFHGLRADGLNQWNVNLVREFKIHERVKFQVRGDAINLTNRSQMNPPDLGVTSTNFSRITSQTSSLNRMYQVQGRIQF